MKMLQAQSELFCFQNKLTTSYGWKNIIQFQWIKYIKMELYRLREQYDMNIQI